MPATQPISDYFWPIEDFGDADEARKTYQPLLWSLSFKTLKIQCMISKQSEWVYQRMGENLFSQSITLTRKSKLLTGLNLQVDKFWQLLIDLMEQPKSSLIFPSMPSNNVIAGLQALPEKSLPESLPIPLRQLKPNVPLSNPHLPDWFCQPKSNFCCQSSQKRGYLL